MDLNHWPTTPLAERMRPHKIGDYAGQESLIADQGPVARMVSSETLHSCIFWGPPGTGKTTLARLLASQGDTQLQELSAVSSGVKDVRAVLAQAREQQEGLFSQRTLLFIDEIHRFNKSQQDALLHAVETGIITLIGATTENPSFEVIPALLSRCQVYILETLSTEALKSIVLRAMKEDVTLSAFDIQIQSWETLLQGAGGDARTLLNRFEQAVQWAVQDCKNQEEATGSPVVLSEALITRVFQRPLAHDKSGESHYNLASALIKSIRGSDPDASIYWLARLIAGGEDPAFIARRLLISAAEDIGNAEPYALSLAQACLQSVKAIGMPESRIILAQTTTYLASCPKSNAAYLSIDKALEEVKYSGDLPVPLHLRNAPTALMKDLDYGKNYAYAHDYPEHFVPQNYFPETIKNSLYYKPTEMGREKFLKARLEKFWPQRHRKKDQNI